MRKLLSLLPQKHRWISLLTILFAIGEVLMETMMPKVIADILNQGIEKQDMSYTLLSGGRLVLMAIFSLVFGVLAAQTSSVASMGFAKELRKALFHRAQDFSFSNIDRLGTSSLITRMTNDVSHVQMAFMTTMRVMLRAPFMLIFATIMAFSINHTLSGVFLCIIPVLSVFLFYVLKNARPRFKKMLKTFDKLNARIQENLIGIRVVKAFARDDWENEHFDNTADEVRNAQIHAERLMILNGPFMQLMIYLCIILILWFGGKMIVFGNMLPGDLTSFLIYVNQILVSLSMVAAGFNFLVISRASVNRINEVLEEIPDIPDSVEEDSSVQDGSIQFRDVSFSYAGNMDNCVLSHINLDIQSGETVGIIGGTGSAKSSLVQLIPRLYEVTNGQVLVGGKDVREYRHSTLREQVAMVLQKNVLFTGTILENLRWGNQEATEEEIIAACKAAQAHDFITDFPNGYQTVLGQGGVNVSGGQKQRLCIARALLKKPKIVILDDSTSAVDTATDSKIREAFQRELSNTTTLIIAQRISSIMDADKIVVLEQGQINAVGTHDQLLETCEIYREVYESQKKGVA
ncbi:MAG: ABC transporter ATP-binding protein [Clostridia bacterium]|nr:ABC transporter ATP-binding protein [Clostridia bacterium]